MALTDIEQVRLLIGDRDTPPIFTDPEIQHFLDIGGSVNSAVGLAARSLSMYFATKADQTTGRMSIAYSGRAKTYADLAIRYGADLRKAAPYIGGISKAEINASRQETDLVQPVFTHDLHNNPNTDGNDAEQLIDP